jgi:hypothetical protein
MATPSRCQKPLGITRISATQPLSKRPLREKQRQVRRPLTEEEKRWNYNRDRTWTQERQPSGLLVFLIRTHLESGIKHEWIDKDETTIESQLPNIIASLLLAGPILIERRRHREEEEKRRREEEHRRYEEQQRRRKDKNQWRRFVELAHLWREAEIARQFLAAIEAKPNIGDVRYDDRATQDWIEWARDHVLKHDPLMSGSESVFKDVANFGAWTYRDEGTPH